MHIVKILLLFLQFILLILLFIIFFRERKFSKIFVDEKLQIKGMSKELLERQKNYFKSKISNSQILLWKWSSYIGLFFMCLAIIMLYSNFAISNFLIGIALLLVNFSMLTSKKIRLTKNDIKKSYINEHPDNDLEFSYFSVIDLNNYKTYTNHLSFVLLLISIVCFFLSIIEYN